MNQDAIFLLHQLAFKQRRLARHALFDDCGPAALRRFAPALHFWVMAFQDLLRINEAQVSDPTLRVIASRHRGDDAGHERWYLSDLEVLRGPRDLDDRATRDASYALVAEVYRATTDAERIVLLLALEAAGHVFFQAIVDRCSIPNLRYFARSHFAVEQAHDLFNGKTRETLACLELGDAAPAARQLVDRVFATFEAMFTGLASHRAVSVRVA
jgi:hypothetical protein